MKRKWRSWKHPLSIVRKAVHTACVFVRKTVVQIRTETHERSICFRFVEYFLFQCVFFIWFTVVNLTSIIIPATMLTLKFTIILCDNLKLYRLILSVVILEIYFSSKAGKYTVVDQYSVIDSKIIKYCSIFISEIFEYGDFNLK